MITILELGLLVQVVRKATLNELEAYSVNIIMSKIADMVAKEETAKVEEKK